MDNDDDGGGVDDKWMRAARAIDSASHLLIAGGAGLSADSGLPVYADVARDEVWHRRGLDYGDLCRTETLVNMPACGFGFWAGCARKYAETQPHKGYSILERWASEKEQANSAVYTSNVDGFFRRFPSLATNLCEIHGCVEEWVCGSGILSPTNGTTPCTAASWLLHPSPVEVAALDRCCQERLLDGGADAHCEDATPRSSDPSDGTLAGVDWGRVPPACTQCGAILRPSVLMFGDKDEALVTRLSAAASRYQEWEDAMETRIALDPSLSLVVVELGCGTRVPSVRLECEAVVHDLRRRGGRALLVRVNPDSEALRPATDGSDLGDDLLCLQETALAALIRLDGLRRPQHGS